MIASNGIFKFGSNDVSKVYKGSILIWGEDNSNPIQIEEFTQTGILRLSTANTSGFPSLYYPKMYLSEPFKPYFSGITKDYIFLYSTNHAKSGSIPIPTNGAIAWGECDSPNLSGYVDRGIIISGYQSETPSILINPNDPNGQHIWFFYHPSQHYPNSGWKQQTRLLTTSGGVNLHDQNWTDLGTILGFTQSELLYSQPHSGYADAYLEEDGTVTVFHVTKGWDNNTLDGLFHYGLSTCSGTDYLFTRLQSDIDITSFMPQGRTFYAAPSLFFSRNNIQYAVARNSTIIQQDININNFIGIYRTNQNYIPTSLLKNISSINGGSNSYNAGYFIDEINDPDTLHIYYVKNNTQMFHTTWDLRNLD
jgi:hypothetical protein